MRLASARRLCDFPLAMARSAASDLASQPPVPGYRLPVNRRVLPMVQTTDCVVALRALGEDTRVRIVGLLLERAMDVGDISSQLGVSAYNVSKHLRVLREAGLLEVEKDGRQRTYALPDAIRRQAAAGKVLDLGCCSFQFEGAALEPSGQGSARQPQPKRRAAQKQHTRRK
jgi:DNA-binding transcriptional ArsR family regulator